MAFSVTHTHLDLETESLGKGSYGGVFRLRDQPNLVAKVSSDEWADDLPYSLREISVLRSCDHPNIIKPVSWNLIPGSDEKQPMVSGHAALLLPAGCENLRKWWFNEEGILADSDEDTPKLASLSVDEKVELKRSPTSPHLDETVCILPHRPPKYTRIVIYQILRAVAYLHARGFMHRDLKPENFIVSTTRNFPLIQLIDFGNAEILSHFDLETWEEVFTVTYRPPELLDTTNGSFRYTYSADMWAVGVIIFELLTGDRLLYPSRLVKSKYDRKVVLKELKGIFGMEPINDPELKLDFRLAEVDPLGADLILRLLQFNPRDRLKASEALQHPFFHTPEVVEFEKLFPAPDLSSVGWLSNLHPQLPRTSIYPRFRHRALRSLFIAEPDLHIAGLAVNIFDRVSAQKDVNSIYLEVMTACHQIASLLMGSHIDSASFEIIYDILQVLEGNLITLPMIFVVEKQTGSELSTQSLSIRILYYLLLLTFPTSTGMEVSSAFLIDYINKRDLDSKVMDQIRNVATREEFRGVFGKDISLT